MQLALVILYVVSAILLLILGPVGFSKEIILDIRLPELFTCLASGGILSVGGVVFQNIFKNPLADPYILGVSSAGALGATIGIWIGKSPSALALILGILVTILVFLVSVILKDNLKVLLFGVGINAFLSSLTLFIFASMPNFSAQDTLFFMLGYIPYLSLNESLLLFSGSFLLLVLLCVLSPYVDIVSFSDELAYFSGISVFKWKILLLSIVSVFVSLLVSKVGIIGFVGIVVPHIARFIGFRRSKELILSSFLISGSIMSLSELIAKTVISPVILPVGVVTGIFGAPMFTYILWRYSYAVRN